MKQDFKFKEGQKIIGGADKESRGLVLECLVTLHNDEFKNFYRILWHDDRGSIHTRYEQNVIDCFYDEDTTFRGFL